MPDIFKSGSPDVTQGVVHWSVDRHAVTHIPLEPSAELLLEVVLESKRLDIKVYIGVLEVSVELNRSRLGENIRL